MPDTEALPTAEQQRAYLAAQRRGYELAAREQRRRLRKLNYEENLPMLDALLDMAYRQGQPQPASGLVELHRLLQRHEARRE
jgi:hypothetical protein